MRDPGYTTNEYKLAAGVAWRCQNCLRINDESVAYCGCGGPTDFNQKDLIERILRDRGINASLEYPGFIFIEQGPLYFNAGTASGHWGIDAHSALSSTWGDCDSYITSDEDKNLTDKVPPIEVADWLTVVIFQMIDQYHGLRGVA